MDSNKRSSVVTKSRLARSIAKAMHIRALTTETSSNNVVKTKRKDRDLKSTQNPSANDADDEVLANNKATEEAFIAKLFAAISSIKAAYAQLQYAQSPYDPVAIHSADRMVVSELKNLSELKQCYLKQQINEKSPEKTLVLAEIQEQSSLLKTYEITAKKLDSQLKLKDSEITFLREKVAAANEDAKSLERILKSSGQLTVPNDVQLLGLRPSHFIASVHQTVKSIRSFLRLIIDGMESANWDLDSAASSIQPGVLFWESSHKGFALESFVCREMFNDFDQPFFSRKTESFVVKEKHRRLFFDRFMELKSLRPLDHLTWKPKSKFAAFCRAKYLKLVHSDMEASLFDNQSQRNLIKSGDFPETYFFIKFAEMAKHVWLLHCLAFSFDPEVSIFQVAKGTRYSEVYMESLSDEAFASTDDPRVAFSVFPGFRISISVVQCQVYLC